MKTPLTAGMYAVAVLATGVLVSSPLAAQNRESDRSAWPSRVAMTLHAAQFSPAGESEAFRLFDRALSRGTDALAPRLSGGTVQVRTWKQWSVVASVEAGDRTVRSFSQRQPAGLTTQVEQQTRLDFTRMQSLGVQWQAWRWTQGAARTERLRLNAGAGAGQMRYTLRQWGSFVDESRMVVFSDDLVSTGRGTFRYLAASAELPLTRWAAVQVDARRHFGSASMSGDYASFDALDLSGARYGVGVTIAPWR